MSSYSSFCPPYRYHPGPQKSSSNNQRKERQRLSMRKLRRSRTECNNTTTVAPIALQLTEDDPTLDADHALDRAMSAFKHGLNEWKRKSIMLQLF